MIQVIADQSVWAVCGRQGAVLNMENNKKQSIIVEVMPLIGGQLALPSVRLSKVGSLKKTTLELVFNGRYAVLEILC